MHDPPSAGLTSVSFCLFLFLVNRIGALWQSQGNLVLTDEALTEIFPQRLRMLQFCFHRDDRFIHQLFQATPEAAFSMR